MFFYVNHTLIHMTWWQVSLLVFWNLKIRSWPKRFGSVSCKILQCCKWYCIILTAFITSSRNDRLTGLPHPRFTVSKQHLFPTLQNAWDDFQSALAVKQEVTLQTYRTTDIHNLNEEYGKSSNDILLRYVNLATASHMEAAKVSAGKLLQPNHGNKLSSRLPGSLVPHSTRKGKDKKLLNTPSPLSLFKAPIRSKATCQPKSHIVFLKTHKTASSTILNILYRYGESRNLTFALPLNKHSQLFYPFSFASHFVEGVNSRSVREFHIMCNHMRFRKSEVSLVTKRYTLYALTVVMHVLHCIHIHVGSKWVNVG